MGDILFLAHRVPFPPNRGDKIRAHHLLRKLAQIAPVHVGCLAESEEDRRAVETLAALATSHCVANRGKPLVLAGAEAALSGKPVSLTAFHSARLETWVKSTIEQAKISTVVIFSGQMGQYVPDDFDGRVIIDLCDVDSAKFENYAQAGERAWLNRREARLLAREEERLARRADAAILISASEAELLRSRLVRPELANIQVVGNGIDASAFDPAKVQPHPALKPRSGPHLVFTGQMDYSPNVDAVIWTARELMPRLHQTFPAAEFHVVGRNPAKAVRELGNANGVKIWGEVPDVRPFLAGATCATAPLRIARGVQNKVLEAMAMARPVLLTTEAATGIAALDGEHWLVSQADPEVMCARLEELLCDTDKQATLGRKARQFVLDNHDWDARLEPLAALVAKPGDDRDAA